MSINQTNIAARNSDSTAVEQLVRVKISVGKNLMSQNMGKVQ
jgi:hypothetical protein